MSKKFFKYCAHSNKDDDDGDAGWLSTFIGIFDFRVNKYSHKLLSHRISGSNKHLDSGSSRRKLDFPSALDIKLEDTNGSFHKDTKLSRKDLMEDEMSKTIALQKNLRIVAKILKNQKHVNQELIFSKECQSKELMEAFQILSSNKELILKLIQDPNSITLKQIQDIRDDISDQKQAPGSFCTKNSKLNINENFQHNESYTKIPIYSPLSHHIIEKGEDGKTKSYFSFKGIRRKLICAIGKNKKEQYLISMDAVLDKIPYWYRDSSCLSENNVLSPRFSPLIQNINSDVGAQSTKDTIEAADIESLEAHYNLDANTELVDDICQKHEKVATNFTVSEPVDSEAKAQISKPLVISPEYLQVEKLEFTQEGNVHTSPVSVLEPFFLDDATSPKSQTADNVVSAILPCKIDFQKQSNAETTSVSSDFESTSSSNKKATCDFITELLQASNSSDQYINQTLFEETRNVHGITIDDSKLYLDCVNEVIKEIKTRLSCFSSWVSMKPSFSLQYYIEEVCNGIERFLQLSQCTLYEMDMKEMKCITWVNHKSEIEDIVIEVADGILGEMIMQIVLKKHADENYLLYINNDTVGNS